jgi:hypothetical protein
VQRILLAQGIASRPPHRTSATRVAHCRRLDHLIAVATNNLLNSHALFREPNSTRQQKTLLLKSVAGEFIERS